MPKRCCVIHTVLLVASMVGGLLFAQDPPALTISPAKATMLVGDTRTFRAVGRDGRMRHAVRWSVSSAQAVTLTTDGDEAILQAKEPSSAVVLTGYADGDSAEANVEIHRGPLPAGTAIWSVAAMPGCKTRKMTQAVPSANGPDLYVEEDCPQGTLIRALTADGRELWRTQLGASGARVPDAPSAKEEVQSHEPLNLRGNSICDAVTSGMTKERVSKLMDDRNLSLEEEQRQGNSWALEEEGFRCTILFGGSTGTVVKKKKTIVTD